MNVPSRKQRNQPSNRVHDIEFATEISTSLLAQVRQLQAVLAEKEENLKAATLENSRLELDAQAFSQRLRSLDESEQRYKDENWSLETQTHDMIAAAKESADREQRLLQTLAVLTAEKGAAQRELDDTKQAHGKLSEEHAAFRKVHDSELASLRKNVSLHETERSMLDRRVEDLQSQNQELAKAYAARIRGDDEAAVGDLGSDPEPFSLERSDPEHSPPPSPSKGMPRHNALESETLKSSLHHAHRMIQTLKSNVHREKTEKMELKRLLQESRDELEVRRSESNGAGNGSRKAKTKSQVEPAKKSVKPSTLGVGRNSRTDIEHIDEPDWEDHDGEGNNQLTAAGARSIKPGATGGKVADMSDAYQTANETEDAFETANERDTTTESEAFQTGNESLSGESSEELTETETRPKRSGTAKARKPSPLNGGMAGNRSSFISTASTSGSDNDQETKTPVQAQPQKYRLRINRGNRRSRVGSEGPTTSSNASSMKNSPASFVSTNGQQGQSLFAELGDLNGNGSGEEMDGTPSRTSIYSQQSNSVLRPSTAKQIMPSIENHPPVPKLPMVDSGMMTDPMENTAPGQAEEGKISIPTAAASTPTSTRTRDFGVQRTPADSRQQVSTSTSTTSPPRHVWDQPLENFVQNIPTFGPALTSTPTSTKSGLRRDAETFDSPRSPEANAKPERAVMSSLTFSQIQTLDLEPIEPVPTIPVRDQRRSILTDTASTPRTSISEAETREATKPGFLDSALGPAPRRSPPAPPVAEDEPGKESEKLTRESGRVPFQEVPANVMQRLPMSRDVPMAKGKAKMLDMADQGSQTLLSSGQIDTLINRKNNMPPPINTGTSQRSSAAVMKPLSDIGAAFPALQRRTSKESIQSISKSMAAREAAPLTKSLPRPGSSGSSRAGPSPMPPLPPDHQRVIAAAAQRTGTPEGPTNNIMGPPTVPASAYRSNSSRPRTTSEPRRTSPNRRTSTTPRVARYSTVRSQMSRRSSMSSFESELDARFNIPADGMLMPQGIEPSTDPRMIQAITQTMIGEYLWKYTRKAGRGEMSTNRHRRFFWVHPYTRTLYWGDQDPATAGRGGLKSKSVAIEAVRVVVDDNPMPPGLHRKSLIVITPGRAVKFTAATGQRHETWFNALSYLLLRTGPETQRTDASAGLDPADIAEFNPSYRAAGPSGTSRASRVSLSSYNSRTPRTASRTGSPARAPSVNRTSYVPPLQPHDPASASSRHSDLPHGSFSTRFSTLLRSRNRSSVRGSMSSQRSKSSVVVPQQQQQGRPQSQQGAAAAAASAVQGGGKAVEGFYDASVVHGSAEDLREVIARQEADADRVENVRACCDGEF